MKTTGRTQRVLRTGCWMACAVTLATGRMNSADRLLSPPSPGAAESGRTGRVEVPFKLYGGYTIVARGSLADRDNLNFLIDTGSSSSVIDTSLARKLRLAKSRKGIKVFEHTVTTEQVIVPYLQVGPLGRPGCRP
jgi:predicted aspartyl protease